MIKKTLFLYLSLSILVSMALTITAIPVSASISSYNWIGETYVGSDGFFGTYVSAYESGSQATLLVNVYNNYYAGNPYWTYRPVNVSAVKVWCDWNINYTSTEVSENIPVVIEPSQYSTFKIVFTIPNTTVASNLVTHNYRIYVEHVDGTTGVKKIVDTWTYSGSNLAVYSSDQADCMEISQKYSSLNSPPTFRYPEAEILWSKAMLESSIAQTSYTRGDFASARTHYQTMNDLINQAFNTEAIKGSNTTDATTNATMIQSYGSLLLGLGVILFGVGIIIYGLRKK